MKPYKQAIWALALLAACDGNPFLVPGDPVDPLPDPGTGIDGDRVLPPGTTSPSRDRSIFRREAKDDTGNGYVTGVSYNNANGEDEFTVDGLAFDGGNVYQRSAPPVASMGPFAVYEADAVYDDDVTGAPINQFTHRAIYGVSATGGTRFAVVRTGAYTDYGFGGFVYQREGSVTLPTTGQAQYNGDYAALRDFQGRGGMEFATGKMQIKIDFNDFNDGAGVSGVVYDRAIFDLNGNDITADVLLALNDKLEANESTLPVLTFTVGPDVMDANGEIVGLLGSSVTTTSAAEKYETGNYYAIVSGDATAGGLDEIVGIIVVESEDPRIDGVTVRETGGFILYRNQ